MVRETDNMRQSMEIIFNYLNQTQQYYIYESFFKMIDNIIANSYSLLK